MWWESGSCSSRAASKAMISSTKVREEGLGHSSFQSGGGRGKMCEKVCRLAGARVTWVVIFHMYQKIQTGSMESLLGLLCH